jgi:hypothetical protein
MLLLAGSVSSCKREAPLPPYEQELVRFEKLYSSADPAVAENGLLSHLDYLEVAKKRGIEGLRFDYCMAVAHGRLFVLYTHTGATQKADKHYAQSIAFWRSDEDRWGRPRTERTPEELAKRIDEKFDGHLDVRWKTNKVNGASTAGHNSINTPIAPILAP